MKKPSVSRERVKTVAQYAGAVVLCLLILAGVLKIWRADSCVPFYYHGDAMLHTMFIKGKVENGWYWQNRFLGAPGGLQMYDFPAVDNMPFLIITLISLLSGNAAFILNLFYLLTFPLATLSSLYVFRHFNISYFPSLTASLLYSFLPYHLMRNESHLFLAAYYPVPLAIMVVLWLFSGRLSIFKDKNRLGFNPRNFWFIVSLGICVLLGMSGVYYPFFFCFFLLVAGVATSINLKQLQPLFLAGTLIVVTSVVVVMNFLPSIAYIYQHGEAQVLQRSHAGAEIYALKIVQLLLPITGHRIPQLAQLKNEYNHAPLVTENDASSLGVIGSIGFLGLLAWLFCPKRSVTAPGRDATATMSRLSVLNIFAVLLATIGGFGSLIALLVSPTIRSYNRISVYIAFFALFAVTLVLDQIVSARSGSRKGRLIFHIVIPAILFIGILDQTSDNFVPNYEGVKAAYLHDSKFVSDIESSVPANAMVFQLPYIPFPEFPNVNKMTDYDHLRGYLHSKNLRWSYGAMKGREADLWQANVASLPIDEFVQRLAFAGFSGVYLDRFGYSDEGALEKQLVSVLKTEPHVSDNQRLLFFNMSDYNSRLRETYSEQEWQKQQEESLHPLIVDWKGGFSDLEVSSEKSWRWSSAEGELHLYNLAARHRPIEIQMLLSTGHLQYDDLLLTSPFLAEQLKINANPRRYTKMLDIPPGHHVIKFRCNAKRVDAPLDSRYLVFKVEDFQIRKLD